VRVVADANVVVSGVIAPLGAPAAVLRGWRADVFELVVSDDILAEYGCVLKYPRIRRRHGLPDDEIAALIDEFRRFATVVEVTERLSIVADDPADDKYLECARAGGAAYIVSGDKHLLDLREHAGIRVLSPRAFLMLLDEPADAQRGP
jgi:putative PIN family toxin of toxin-antitoxin system